MTAPSKVSGSPRVVISPRDVLKARRLEARKFAISDGAPVEVVESGPSLVARLAALASRVAVRPVLAVGSYLPHAPWPWGVIDQAARVLLPASTTVRAAVSRLMRPPNWFGRRVCCRRTALDAPSCTCTAARF